MKIAIAGVVTKQITEHPLGGTEAFTSILIEGLVKRGHEVTLYCAKDSRTKAQRQVEICNSEDAMGGESNLEFVYPYTLIEADRIIKDIPKYNFDLIHVNILKTFFFTYFADQIKIPIIHTMHRDFFEREKIVKLYEEIGFKNNEHFVFVSNSAFSHSLVKKNTFHVFNGINVSKYPFSSHPTGDFLLWLSRIDPLKGPVEAIGSALGSNKKLILSGDIDREKYQKYFDDELKEKISTNSSLISYEKPVSLERNLELFQNAKAFIFPIRWEEPCPLTVLESLASGTPLVTYARGSLVESMADGVTGFLVNPSDQDIRGNFIVKKTGLDGLIEGVKRIYSLTNEQYMKMRAACRQRIEQNFTNDIMVDKYVDIYKEILNK